VPPEAEPPVSPAALLKALLSVALLAWVFSRLDAGAAGAALARLDPVTLLAAAALFFAAYWARALRWSLLLRHAAIEVPPLESYRLTLVGVLYGLVTPGRIGELGRVLHLRWPRARTLPSALWDRLSDVLLLELLSLPAFAVLSLHRTALFWIFLAVVALTLGLVATLNSRRLLAAAIRRFPRLGPRLEIWREGAAGVVGSGRFGLSLAAGLVFYALNFTGALLLLRSLAPGSSAAFTLVFPVLILLGNVPISFGGLGVREQVAAMTFTQLGAAPAVGPVFSLVWFSLATLAPAVAGAVLMRKRPAAAARERGGAESPPVARVPDA